MTDINELFDSRPFKPKYAHLPARDAEADDADDVAYGAASSNNSILLDATSAIPFQRRSAVYVDNGAPTTEKTPPSSSSPPVRQLSCHMDHVDHGYAWVVLFASFFINMLVLGITNSFAVYYTVFLRAFGKTKASTTWIGAMHVGLMFFV
ncbi:PREDICTED: uncharacterized protein LOC106815275, partial [Priapulus caudatus]|uniref:Uncharacterized protein LOC106815275 n=1 Tax=Priapulus caudatus TaxID=37621 RepID=A0ABM1ESN7_PRICU